MQVSEFTADDQDTLADVVELVNAAAKLDAPWMHPETMTSYAGHIRYGWDGEPPRAFVARVSGRAAAVATLWTSEWDNTHLAWLGGAVHPDERRRGIGGELLEHLLGQARAMGRSSVGFDGWDSPAVRGFAARYGFGQRAVEVNRRYHVGDVPPEELQRLYDDTVTASADYDLVRITGRTPEDLRDAVAEMTAAINDAPTDELDIEDEVFPPERVARYEEVTLARGKRLYRVVARHRGTGRLAGHTVVAVEEERPQIGDQHDTSVVREHRGHRLGLRLKADMLRWLAEEEPQLRTIDTWNAESNDHMIGVNERLGYRVLGRTLAFQREL